MSLRRKKGDLIAIIVSIIIAIFLASALIYGSEYRRRKDLEELHEKALQSVELSLNFRKKPETPELKPQPSNPCEDVNSFGDMIRAMPSDPNTPLLAPDYDDDTNNKESGDTIVKSDKEIVNTVKCDKKIVNTDKEIIKSNISSANNDISSVKSDNTSVKKDITNTPPNPSRSSPKLLTQSENIVPFQPPQPQSNPRFDVKDEIESIRRQVAADKINNEEVKADLGGKPENKQPPLPPPSPKSPKKGNIIFDPVPGLFPKTFVDRFFKKRRVRVIMYGPKNSKREFVMNGGGNKLTERV